MKCQYEHGCVRMAADNGANLCMFHFDLPLKEGDEFEGKEGTYTVGKLMAYQGREGCTDIMCRHQFGGEYPGTCYGYHCANCDKHSSMYGHSDQAHCDATEEQPMGVEYWLEHGKVRSDGE